MKSEKQNTAHHFSNSLSGKETFQFLFEHHPLPMWIYDLKTLKFLAVNDAAVEKYGYTHDEFLGMTLKEIRPVEDVPQLLADVGKKRPEIQHSSEWRHRLKDGSIIYVDITSHTIDFNGRKAALVFSQDTTERKRSEQALRESEERYRNLLDVAPVGIAVHCEGKIVFTNNGGMKLLGASSPRELIGKPITEIIHPDGLAKSQARIQRMIAGKQGLYPAEDRYIRLDGTAINVEVMASLLTYNGKPAVQVIVTDITERKKAEELLRKSEEKFSVIFKKAPFAASLARISDGRIEEINEEFERVLGYSREEVIGKTSLDLGMYPDPDERAKTVTLVREHGFAHNIEMRLQTKSGELRDFLINTDFVQIGTEKYALTTAKDITERKKSEENIFKSEKKFRAIWEDSIEAMRLADTFGCTILVNDAFCTLVGKKREELEGQSIAEIHRPDLKENVLQSYLHRCGERSANKHYEGIIHLWNGKDIYVEGGHTFLDIPDQPTLLLSVFRDVSNRNKAEGKLRLYTERLEEAEMHAGLGSWEYNPHTDQRWWSKSLYHMLHFKPSVDVPDYEAFVDHVHPDDQEIVKEAQHKMYQGVDLPPHEFRTNPKYGPVHILSSILRTDKTADGASVMYRGTVLDITERKRTEQQIVKLNRVYAVLSNINQAIVRIHEQQQLFDDVCRIAIDDGKFIMAWIGMLDESSQDVKIIAYAGAETVFLNSLRINIADEKRSTGPTGRAIKTGRHALSMDIEHDELMRPWRDAILALGCRSSGSFPFKVSGTTVGTLTLYSNEANFFDPNEVKLLDELASDISFALEFIHQEERRKQAEAFLVHSELFFRAVWDHSASGMRITNESGSVVSVNDAYCRMVEKSKNEIEGSLLSDVYAEQDRARIVDKHKANFSSKSVPVFLEKNMTLWNGKNVWFEVSNSFLEIMGRQSLLLGVFTDITNRKQSEESQRSIEQKYREVVETANEVIYTTDLKGYFTYVNPAGIHKTGYTSEEFSRLNYLDLILPEHRTKVKKFYLRQFAEKLQSGQFQFPFVSKSGEIIWFEQNSTLLIEDGIVTGMQFIARDITERKSIEDALSESTERFRQLAENIREIFWLTDSVTHRMLYASPAYESIWGQSLESLYASPVKWFDAIHPGDRERILHAVRTKQTAGTYDETYRITRPDGTVRWIHDRAYPIQDPTGSVYRIAGVAEDITNQMINEESRKTLEAQLLQAQKLESLGTLASGIAHDFNNILGIIIAHASMLSKIATTPDVVAKSSEAIMKAGMRGAGLVKQMLTFARKTDVNVTTVHLNEIVSDVSKLLSETFPKTIVVSLHLENKLPALSADATQVHQVLLNLCVNARDAMENNGTLTVTTRVQSGISLRSHILKAPADEYIELNVRDTGTGMSEETKRRIFEPFFTTKELGKGTGLGLSLVFGIMETHGGFVEVESEIGKGTAFRCYFPVKKQTKNSTEQNVQELETVEGGTETILLVEDEELLVDLVKQLLEGKGYSVLIARDGEEGLLMYEKNRDKINLIISDMGLPKFGGYELFQKIKAIDENVRLIFASGYIEPGTKEKILTEGVKQFIQKPYELNEVLRAVRDALR